MLTSPPAEGRAFLRELAVAVGFGAVGILGMQFALSARLKRLKAPYGVDAVLHLHRKMALIALGIVLTHPILLFVDTPSRLSLLNAFTAPWATRSALAAVLVIAAIVVFSVWRMRLGVRYEVWRGYHDVMAPAVLVFVALHASNVGIYTEGWKLSAFLAYPALWIGLLAYTRVGKPLLKSRRPYRIRELRREAPDVWTLEIEPEGHRGLRFRAGQFAWFTIGRSPFSLDEHPFSFCSAPVTGKGGFGITVKELGDFTSRIGGFEPGTIVYVEGPFGSFTTDRYPAESRVYIAGGIGITPIMSHLRDAAARDDRTPITLVYGATTLDDLVFSTEIDELARELDLHVTYVLEQPPGDWRGQAGFITRDVLEAAIEEPCDHEYFICGPPAMTDAVQNSLDAMSVPTKCLHYERFAFV
jgi:predicted ferric reductase